MTGRKPKSRPVGPDGQAAEPRDDRDASTRSKVSEVQDPAISGDAGPPRRDGEGGAAVDEAGQIRPARDGPDLLH